MPSARRVKVFAVLMFVGVVTLLFYTGSLRQQRYQDSQVVEDFYEKTVNALDKKTGSNGGSSDDGEVARAMQQRLNEAAKVAKDNANAKAPKPDPPSAVIGVGSAADGKGQERSVAGRKKYGGDVQQQQPIVEETEEDHEVEVELNSILKKSPIIIFSKTTCPCSRRAKATLLEKYNIDPNPYVVELDKHPIGARLQARLAELTNRRTVPNILINGVSIGGGDDIVELDSTGTLIEKVKDLGGKKMTLVIEKIEKPHGLR